MKFVNPSCRGIYRTYPGFQLEIPGNTTVELPVPAEHAENVKRFLETHHPVVVVHDPGREILAEGWQRIREMAETPPPAAVVAEQADHGRSYRDAWQLANSSTEAPAAAPQRPQSTKPARGGKRK